MKNILQRALGVVVRAMDKCLRHVRYVVSQYPMPDVFMHQQVPYFSQWETPELNRAILSGETRAQDDPAWRRSGARTKAEYAEWSWNGCGMACLKMLLAHHSHVVYPLVGLGNACMKYGGYIEPLSCSAGLQYVPFVAYINKEFGLQGRVMPSMSVRDIITELSVGNFVLASVSPLIRAPVVRPSKRGGHLVLMLGYDLTNHMLYFHNPSGTSHSTQEYSEVTFKRFRECFAGRGIAIEP